MESNCSIPFLTECFDFRHCGAISLYPRRSLTNWKASFSFLFILCWNLKFGQQHFKTVLRKNRCTNISCYLCARQLNWRLLGSPTLTHVGTGRPAGLKRWHRSEQPSNRPGLQERELGSSLSQILSLLPALPSPQDASVPRPQTPMPAWVSCHKLVRPSHCSSMGRLVHILAPAFWLLSCCRHASMFATLIGQHKGLAANRGLEIVQTIILICFSIFR